MLDFKLLQDCTNIVATDDERYFINNSKNEVAITKSDLSKSDLIEAFEDFESILRNGVVNALCTPVQDAEEIPVNSLGSKESKQGDDNPLIGKINTTRIDGFGGHKFGYLMGLDNAYHAWMHSRGLIPLITKRNGEQFYPKRLRKDAHGTTIGELILKQSNAEFRQMLTDIIIEQKSPLNKDIIRYPNFDLEAVLGLLWSIDEDDAITVSLNAIHNGIFANRKALTNYSDLEKTWCLYLQYCCQKFWKLPTGQYAGTSNVWMSLRLPRFNASLFEAFAPKERLAEFNYAIDWVKKHYASDASTRSLTHREVYVLFACSNYDTSTDFDLDALDLIRASVNQHFNVTGIPPYIRALTDFYGLDDNAKREVESRLSVRASAKKIQEDPFALFRLPSNEAKAILKAQVRTFERKTKLPFPDEFPSFFEDWIQEFETRIKQINRKDYDVLIKGATEWIFYLYTLGIDAPRDWSEVNRDQHISSRNSEQKTVLKYLESNQMKPTTPMRSLEQLWQRWHREYPSDIPCPISTRYDIKDNTKKGRTHRRSIPSIIVETLIEENAKACENGIPYAFHRSLKSGNGGASLTEYTKRVGDDLVTAEYPLAAAVIDCILHLGMRSSSARYLDDGHDDEYTVLLNQDIDGGEYLDNPNGKKGVRNGAIQLMQIGPEHSVLSMLMLKDKVADFNEVPWVPQPLAERLTHIKNIQEKYNPISEPIPATDAKDKYSIEATVNHVYPLFRDPSNFDNKPVSTDKIARYWNTLLKHCEPIVNEKRRAQMGDNATHYGFFDRDGKAVWDIHSIRVTVITNLLEQGVPPTIIQLLVGHKSPLMTLHYEAIDNAKLHETITQAYEQRRLASINAISSAESEEEVQQAIENMLGGLAKSASNDNEAFELMQENFGKFKTQSDVPSGMSVFSHGICPGGNCATGGEKKGATYTAVHRPKACSRCRWRVTGPSFLAGLTLNANILMAEISASTQKEKELIAELNKHKDAELPTPQIESRINQERAFRDELFADWAAEYTTIQHALELQKGNKDGADKSLPTVADMNISFSEKHTVTMMHEICKEAAMIQGASMDVPDGLEAKRDKILFDIAIQNNAANYLISVDKDARNQAFNDFAEMLIQLEDTAPNGADYIQQLVTGEEKIPALENGQASTPKNLLEAS